MSSMDKSHKSEEAFGQSQSSCSRRVMWKLSDEVETFDSIVNYRRVPSRTLQSTNVTTEQQPQASTSKACSSSNYAADAWHQIFKLIRSNKLAEELNHQPSASPSLALRYKPSRESLKYRRSKDLSAEKAVQQKQQQQQQLQQQQLQQLQATTIAPPPAKVHRLIITDLKMESCCLPPQQMAVVREVAPTFAARIPNDTDSCCSGELEAPQNSPVMNVSVSSMLASANAQTQPQRISPPTAKLMLTNGNVTKPANSCASFISTQNSATKSNNTAPPNQQKRRQGTANNGNKMTTTSTTMTMTTGNKWSGNAGGKQSGSSSNNMNFPTFRQRQLELHRYRVQVEQRRLDLLELKIAREREEAVHNEILFHKDLQIREHQMKSFDDCSNA
ncbi:probable basic-leucine zipper transcription factor N isoform X2 [Scaptodrosophila lebanonensis]|nr:probable basic-leucine zipper transcription factor N isoform X2 [Scaptodrosophila lebanonensis]